MSRHSYNAIAYKLNDLHIPARKGLWSQTSIVNILTNEVYLGKIRWRYEPSKRVIQDGMLTKKRIINDDYELYDGRHEPIISQEQWDLVKAAQTKRYHQPTHTDRHLQNPFAGILYCERCGASIKRKVPHKDRTCIPWYQCSTRGCDAKMVKCEVVENAILEAMEDWLREYTLQINSGEQPKINPIETALETVRGQLAGLLKQQENICEYPEKGIYTVEMFNKRNTSLAQEIEKLQASEADLMDQLRDSDSQKKSALQIIPATQHILDNYQHFTTEEKNRLWKLVLKKNAVYRSQEDELTIHLYPNLPQ